MKIKSLEELQAVDERTLSFTPLGLGKMRSEDSADFQQRMVAELQLADDVAETTRQKFEQLRAAFIHGVLCYELFTLVEDATRLALEQALRDRFAAYHQGKVVAVRDQGQHVHQIQVTNYHAFYEQFRKMRGPRIRMGTARDWKRFNGTLDGLLTWARSEGLLRGQRNRSLQRTQRALRNMVAHGTYHLTSPVDAFRALSDLAEVINHLWGHPTPGGRLYPAPVERNIMAIGWTSGGSRTLIANAEQLANSDQADGLTFVLLRAVANDPHLTQFDARKATTMFPTEYLWGPGNREEAAKWLDGHQPAHDRCDYLDQVLLLRVHDGRVDLPVYPGVAAGLSEAEQVGTWYAVRVDRALDALRHTRAVISSAQGHARDGECPSCPVETLATGDIANALDVACGAGANIVPVRVPDVRTPLAERFPRSVAVTE